MAVSISLADDIDISRGDMISRPHNQPTSTQEFDATLCWMADEASLEPGRDYVIKHTTRTTRARVVTWITGWTSTPCIATRAQRR